MRPPPPPSPFGGTTYGIDDLLRCRKLVAARIADLRMRGQAPDCLPHQQLIEELIAQLTAPTSNIGYYKSRELKPEEIATIEWALRL